MHKTCKIGSLWLHFLLGALAFQAFTPDTNSLASRRLFRVFDPIGEGGGPRASFHFGCRCLAILIETSRPIPGSVPDRDCHQEPEPDEVCVPACASACHLARREAGDPHPLELSAHRFTQPRVRTIGRISPSCCDPIRWTGGLIDSLFRLTC